jgi:hypothetical protein
LDTVSDASNNAPFDCMCNFQLAISVTFRLLPGTDRLALMNREAF